MKKNKVLIILTCCIFNFTFLKMPPQLAFAKNSEIFLSVNSPNVLLNGNLVSIDSSDKSLTPYIDKSNTAFVPLAFVSEILGYKTDFDIKNNSITITNNSKKYIMTINSTNVKINDTTKDIKVSPILINNKVFLPLRAFVQDVLEQNLIYEKGVIQISSKSNLTKNSEKFQDAKLKLNFLNTVKDSSDFSNLLKTKINFQNTANNSKEIASYNNSKEIASSQIQIQPTVENNSIENSIKTESSSADSTSSSKIAATGYAGYSDNFTDADIIKMHNNLIYYLQSNSIHVVDISNPSNMTLLKSIDLQSSINTSENTFYVRDFLIDDTNLVVIGTYTKNFSDNFHKMSDMHMPYYDTSKTKVDIYKISNNTNFELSRSFDMDGNYLFSKKNGNNLILTSNRYFYSLPDNNTPSSDLLTSYFDSSVGASKKVDYTSIQYFPNISSSNFLNIALIDIFDDKKPADVKSYLGASYSNITTLNDNIYISSINYNYDDPNNRKSTTDIYQFDTSSNSIVFDKKTTVDGEIVSMNPYNNTIRFVTNMYAWSNDADNSVINLYIYDADLNKLGSIDNIAQGQYISSTKYIQDKIYLLTFKTENPLFVIDVQNPSDPKILSQLKMPGYNTYLHPYKQNYLIGFGHETSQEIVPYTDQPQTVYKGLKLSLFDISDDYNPKEVHKDILGDTGTYSDVFYNQKPLVVDEENNLIVFPVNVIKKGVERFDDVDYYATYSFNGVAIYNLDISNGFSSPKLISHFKNQEDYTSTIQRILYLDDVLFTLTSNQIFATNIKTMSTLSNLKF